MISLIKKHLNTLSISGTYDDKGKMTCTDDAGMGTFLPLDAIYASGEEVIKAFLDGKDFSSETVKNESGAAGAASDDFTAFTQVKTEGVLDWELVFDKLPDAYNTYDTQYKGTEMIVHRATGLIWIFQRHNLKHFWIIYSIRNMG